MSERIDAFDSSAEIVDYDKLIKEFGTKPMTSKEAPKGIRAFDLGLFFSHRDFDKFMDAVKKGEKATILTGFNASGSIHLGHTIVFNTVVAMQKKYGIPVYIPISDDESFLFNKVKDQEEGLKNAKIIASQMVALGFDVKKTKIFIHQIHTEIYNFAIELSKKCTLSTLKAIYGFDDSTNSGAMFYPLIQVADILYPQKLLGPHMTLVPIGMDQDPHIRLARDLAEKVGLMKPAAIHSKFLHGLKGGKMSKSVEGSAIFMNEDPKKAAKILMSALTGGRETTEEQKKLGGIPEKCIVYEYLTTFFDSAEEAKKRYDTCKKGKVLCGDHKKELVDKVTKLLTEFQAKAKAADIEKFVLK